MALEAPLRSSTGNHHFPFAAQENMSGPAENERLRSPFRHLSSPPPATDSSLLRPSSVNRVSSHSTHMMSPSDIVGPSPVTSNGTETTEIEDDASDEIDVLSNTGSSSQRSELLMLTTNLPDTMRQNNSEETISVIHAPESFVNWTANNSVASDKPRSERSSPRADDSSLDGTPQPVNNSSSKRPTFTKTHGFARSILTGLPVSLLPQTSSLYGTA
jgi:hypothetical protein